MHSGDLGRFDEDGFFILRDRQKDMINSRGFNVIAVDLETTLLNQANMAEAAIIAVSSERWRETPLVLVVARSGVSPDVSDVLTTTNAKLGKTQRLSAIEVSDELPRSDIGKVLERTWRP